MREPGSVGRLPSQRATWSGTAAQDVSWARLRARAAWMPALASAGPRSPLGRSGADRRGRLSPSPLNPLPLNPPLFVLGGLRGSPFSSPFSGRWSASLLWPVVGHSGRARSATLVSTPQVFRVAGGRPVWTPCVVDHVVVAVAPLALAQHATLAHSLDAGADGAPRHAAGHFANRGDGRIAALRHVEIGEHDQDANVAVLEARDRVRCRHALARRLPAFRSIAKFRPAHGTVLPLCASRESRHGRGDLVRLWLVRRGAA